MGVRLSMTGVPCVFIAGRKLEEHVRKFAKFNFFAEQSHLFALSPSFIMKAVLVETNYGKGGSNQRC